MFKIHHAGSEPSIYYCVVVVVVVVVCSGSLDAPVTGDMYLRDGSAHAVCRCCHTEIKVADHTSSPSHRILTPGRLVQALTL